MEQTRAFGNLTPMNSFSNASLRTSFFAVAVGLVFAACGGATTDEGGGGGGTGATGSGVGGLNEDGNNRRGYGEGNEVYENDSFAGCTDPVDLVSGVDTGYYACSEPIIWRKDVVECPNNLPQDNVVDFPSIVLDNLGGAPGDSGYEIVADECSSNADCDEKSRCVVRQVNATGECIDPPGPYVSQWGRSCEPGCTVDADCSENQVCLCDTEIGRCAARAYVHGCASDADCDQGYHCLMNLNASFACQLPGDECHSSVGCDANQMCGYDHHADARLCVDYEDGGC